MAEVIRPCSKHTEVVDEDFQKLPQLFVEDICHHPLDCSRRVAQAKWHFVIRVGSQVGREGCLILVLLPDGYLVIPRESVEQTITLVPRNMVQNDIREWEEVMILPRHRVQLSKILTHLDLPR